MKPFVTLFVAVVSLLIASSKSIQLPDELKQLFVDSMKVCQDATPELEAETLASLKNHESVMVESDASKNFIWCLQKQIGLQNEDGTFNVAKMKETAFTVTGTHDYDSVFDECTKEDHHDPVENAWAYMTCSQPKLPKLELD